MKLLKEVAMIFLLGIMVTPVFAGSNKKFSRTTITKETERSIYLKKIIDSDLYEYSSTHVVYSFIIERLKNNRKHGKVEQDTKENPKTNLHYQITPYKDDRVLVKVTDTSTEKSQQHLGTFKLGSWQELEDGKNVQISLTELSQEKIDEMFHKSLMKKQTEKNQDYLTKHPKLKCSFKEPEINITREGTMTLTVDQESMKVSYPPCIITIITICE